MNKLTYVCLLSFMFWLSGCNDDSLISVGEDDITNFNKAGTNFTNANTFDGDGNLCLEVNGSPQTIGTPLEIWMGVGNNKAGTLIGHGKFSDNPDPDPDALPGLVTINLLDFDGDDVPDMYPYIIRTAHVHFAKNADGIPHTKKGNPIPGQFEYKVDFDAYKSIIKIPVEFDAVGAIHLAVDYISGIEGFEEMLPDLVKMSVSRTGTDSYFQMTISGDEAGDLAGTYDSWCVDVETGLIPGTVYDATIYSSYETIPDGVVDKPENFDKVNYLINNFVAGDMIQPMDENCNPVGEQEALTWQDVQKAVWHFIDNDQYNPGPPWSQARINAIMCAVESSGEGFVPDCEEKIAFLVVPIGDINQFQIVVGQPQISSLPIPCEVGEGGTAWGDGYYGATFLGSKQWGTWFNYDLECLP